MDGAAAIVLLKTAIEMLGGKVDFRVPPRLREGYGMQAAVLGAAAGQGVSLVIHVDTGIRDFVAADAAARLGLDLIVTDHHLPQDFPFLSSIPVLSHGPRHPQPQPAGLRLLAAPLRRRGSL